MASSNQFLAAQEQGLEPGDENYPKGTNQFIKGTREEMPEEVRKRINVAKIVNKLQTIIDDESTESVHVLAASKILLDKSLSSLSSVDQTVRDERELDDPQAVEARLRMLIAKAEPALLSRILGERARQSQDTPVEAVPAEDNAA